MPLDEALYPVNLRVARRRCLVVGAGRVAAQKAAGLLECDAIVTVVAPDVSSAVRELETQVRIVERRYRPSDLDGMRLVITATDDPAVNARVYHDGEAAGIWVNSADDPANCGFTLPARVRRGPLLVTASTQGHSPALATWLRRRFEEEFGPEYEVLLEILAEARAELRARGASTEGLGWQNALDSGMLELVRQGRPIEAKERLQACLSSSSE